MLRLNCFISVLPENRETVLKYACKLTEASLKQDGCIAYDIFSSETRPQVLMICETWKNQESLDAHSASEVFVELVGKMKALAEFKTEIFEF